MSRLSASINSGRLIVFKIGLPSTNELTQWVYGDAEPPGNDAIQTSGMR
jgi:hypothetical protein